MVRRMLHGYGVGRLSRRGDW